MQHEELSRLRLKLEEQYPNVSGKNLFTIGDAGNEIHIYEHVKGLSKYRQLKEFNGFNIVYKFVGKILPAKAV